MTGPVNGDGPARAAAAEPEARTALTRLASRVLYRLARLFIHQGLSYGDLQALARHAFCTAAEAHLEAEGARPSGSRVAILTGLTRADVARTRRLADLPTSPAHYQQRSGRIVHGWQTDPRFTDVAGEPRCLPLTGDDSFAALCKAYSGDIPSRAVLDDLLLRAACVLTADGVRLQRTSAAPALPFAYDEAVATLDAAFRAHDPRETSARVRCLSVTFPGTRPPSHVLRVCRARVESFLEALASYVHHEAHVRPPAEEAVTLSYMLLEDTRAEKSPP